MEEKEKYWQQIRQYVRDRFGMPGEVYDIVFLIGVREMGYGFQQLDQDTKTKVFNFASIYLMNFMSGEERGRIIKPSAEADRNYTDRNYTDRHCADGHYVDGHCADRHCADGDCADGDWDLEEQIYKQAIINYFREKKII